MLSQQKYGRKRAALASAREHSGLLTTLSDVFANDPCCARAMNNLPLVAPVFPAGKEPLPPGISDEDRDNYLQAKKYQDYMTVGMESCVAKTIIAGGGGVCSYQITRVLRC